jgi:hypothetical protein
MTRPDGKTQAQVVDEELAKAHQETDIGRSMRPGSEFVVQLDFEDLSAIQDILQYFFSELAALRHIVESLADAIDRLEAG